MGSSEFYVDFNIDVPDIGEAFVEEAERRLRGMADGHTDIVGAAVALEKPVKAETAYLHEVRIVLYKKPQVLTVTEEHADPMAALRGALDALEGQVVKSREKLRERGVPSSEQTDNVIYGLTAQEVYATYAKGMDPSQLWRRGGRRSPAG